MKIRIQRLPSARPHRDDVWAFIDALQTQMALHHDDNAHTVASVLCAAAVLRGTRRGALIEVGFVATQVLLGLVAAIIPRPSRVRCMCNTPVPGLYVVYWLRRAFIFGEPIHYHPPDPPQVVTVKDSNDLPN